MSNLREAAQNALDALTTHADDDVFVLQTIHHLACQLAKPDDKEKPIGWMRPDELQKAKHAPYMCRVHPEKDKHTDMIPVFSVPQPPAEQAARVYPDHLTQVAGQSLKMQTVIEAAWKRDPYALAMALMSEPATRDEIEAEQSPWLSDYPPLDPDVEDESGLLAYFSRDAVLEAIAAYRAARGGAV